MSVGMGAGAEGPAVATGTGGADRAGAGGLEPKPSVGSRRCHGIGLELEKLSSRGSLGQLATPIGGRQRASRDRDW
jgi:hypothetical protein